MKKILLILLLSPIVFADNLVIEDFKNNRAQWDAVSDQVMGGLSEIKFTKLSDEDINFYRLEGEVSTKNNGGFIQFRSRVDAGSDDVSNGIRSFRERCDTKNIRFFKNFKRIIRYR